MGILISLLKSEVVDIRSKTLYCLSGVLQPVSSSAEQYTLALQKLAFYKGWSVLKTTLSGMHIYDSTAYSITNVMDRPLCKLPEKVHFSAILHVNSRCKATSNRHNTESTIARNCGCFDENAFWFL